MTARERWAEVIALAEVAQAESRVEGLTFEARLARFRLAAELEQQGRPEEAKKILDELNATRPA